jgi:hypothetical protein
MAVEVQELSTSDSAALKRFVVLERTLIGANPLFVSEMDADVLKCLSGRSNYYSEMEYTLFIALNNGQHVARCTALINHRYQRAKREALGFVGHFAAASESSHAVGRMLEQAEVWLRERGVTRVVGPFNGAGNLGAGVSPQHSTKNRSFRFGGTRPTMPAISPMPVTLPRIRFGSTPSISPPTDIATPSVG